MKPKVYISHEWEYREGFTYEQPVDYCNGVRVDYENISKFKELFGVDFTTAQRESKAYNDTMKHSLYNSDLWKNEGAKDRAFEKIHSYALKGRSGSGSSVTPLFPFEIFMMNDGFEMISFSELNAINSGIAFIADKIIDGVIYNPTGIVKTRYYLKDDLLISLGFGIEINNRKINFYFETNKSHGIFQVDNNIESYKKAISGNLEDLLIKCCRD